MAEVEVKKDETQRPRLCRYYLSWNGCREGEKCSFKHDDEIPPCKYYKYGCWNGRWCRFRHCEPQEKSESQHFYQELNQWLGPSKLDESTCSNMNDSLLVESAKGPNPEKKYVSRATQTKPTPEFIHCGECGEEFKSGRTLQQSLERHYIHMLASADFYHIRFFRRHTQLRRSDALCAACGEVFRSVESLLQHMGARVSGMSQDPSLRVEHQNWFKQLVQPFVYRDLEVLESDEDLIHRLLEIYFVKAHDESSTLVADSESESPNKILARIRMRSPRKGKTDDNNNESTEYDYIYCGECGEMFDEPESENKLRIHHEDMLSRADNLHVQVFRKNSSLESEAMCRVCRKIFSSPVPLMQHIGSKKKLAENDDTGGSIQHAELLFEIAEVFMERDLEIENCSSTEQVVERLVAIVTPSGRRKSVEIPGQSKKEPAEPKRREANVDDTLEMARYFCQVNKWQARMSYAEYVRDDHERTRNNGFTIGEVEYLTSIGLRPDSPAAFKALNVLYKKKNYRGPLRSQKNKRRQSKDQGAVTPDTTSTPNVNKEGVKEVKKVTPQPARKGSTSTPVANAVSKVSEKITVQSQTSVTETTKEDEGTGDQSPKPKRKRPRRRSYRSQRSIDRSMTEDSEQGRREGKDVGKAKRRPSGRNARRQALLRRKREAREKDNAPKVRMLFQVDQDGRVYIQMAPEPEEEKEESKQKQVVVYKDRKDILKVDAQESKVFVAREDGLIDVKDEEKKKREARKEGAAESGGEIGESVDGNVMGKEAEVAGVSESVELISVLKTEDKNEVKKTELESSKAGEAKDATQEEMKEVSVPVDTDNVPEKETGEIEKINGGGTGGKNQVIKKNDQADIECDMVEIKLDKHEVVAETSAPENAPPEAPTNGENPSGGEEKKIAEKKDDENANMLEDDGATSEETTDEMGCQTTSSSVREQVRKIEEGILSVGGSKPETETNTDKDAMTTDEINNNVESDQINRKEVESCVCLQTDGEESGRTAV